MRRRSWPLFETLDWLEERLGERATCSGSELDRGRLAAVSDGRSLRRRLLRHFKCNLRRIVDYPNLWGYTRELYQLPRIAATVELDEIKQHYYGTHARAEPVTDRPGRSAAIDFSTPHGRG